MKTANCPTCGALVTFRTVASIMAVCEYCRSTLIRRGADIENIGKMAELLEDASVVQLGTEGKYRGMHFVVIGRIQLQYPQGVWNEWHLLFDNQRSGWLSDANGDYTVTFLAKVPEPLPALDQVKAGMEVMLNGVPFTVTDLEHGKCIAGAGELLFKVGAGFDAPSADLRSARDFASIDYSEDIPLLFLGASVDFADLHFANLRDASQVGVGKIKLNAIQCPSCGATIEIHAPGILRVTCGSCHSLIDDDNENLKVLRKFSAQQLIDPFIPLGAEGKFKGVSYRVIGFLRRAGKSDGVIYSWDEYLLHHPAEGFRWLTEYDGHWNFAWPANAAPAKSFTMKGQRALLYAGQMYRHFEESQAKVAYVAGEFYWRVSTDETVTVNDYISPPCILSEEKSGNEITWTVGEYIEPEEVKNAFAIAQPMPERNGVAPNQPWPHGAGYRQVWRSFWYVTLIAFVVQIISVAMADNRIVYSTALSFPAGNSEAVTTPVFEITGRAGNLHIINNTDLDNNWIHLDMELVARDTGRIYAVRREVSYYSGYDDGYWSEGDRRDDAEIANVPPGHYLLSVDTESTPSPARGVTTQLQIRRNVSNWHNFIIVEILLLLFPVIYWLRRSTFEARRWSGSEYPQKTTGEKIQSLLESDSDD
jgi:ribosomal protein S27AE